MADRGRTRTRTKNQMKQGEQTPLSPRWKDHFLDLLAETSNVSEAARQTGVPTSRAYKLRRQNPKFARAWMQALWEGYTHLEMEVLRRLREGDTSVGEGGKFDFANAIRLLNAHRDNVARMQADQRNVSAAEVRASIDRKIDEIRTRLSQEKQRETKSR